MAVARYRVCMTQGHATHGNEPPHPTDLLTGGAGPHSPTDDAEVVYYEGSPLLRGELGLLIMWVVIGLLLASVPFWFAFFSESGEFGPWWTWLFVLVGLALVFFPSLWVKRNRYKITNYRIDHEFGLITKNIDTLELWHVDDIRMRQGVLDRIFGVGSIHIDSDDRSTPKLEIRSISNPRPLYESLKQRVIAVKRQRGVIKMDTGG